MVQETLSQPEESVEHGVKRGKSEGTWTWNCMSGDCKKPKRWIATFKKDEGGHTEIVKGEYPKFIDNRPYHQECTAT